jgi:hypothetical protein
MVLTISSTVCHTASSSASIAQMLELRVDAFINVDSSLPTIIYQLDKHIDFISDGPGFRLIFMW